MRPLGCCYATWILVSARYFEIVGRVRKNLPPRHGLFRPARFRSCRVFLPGCVRCVSRRDRELAAMARARREWEHANGKTSDPVGRVASAVEGAAAGKRFVNAHRVERTHLCDGADRWSGCVAGFRLVRKTALADPARR